MPIENTPRTATFTASGFVAAFDFLFRAFAEADLVVKVDDVIKTLGVDYTVTLGNTGGTVTFEAEEIPAAASIVEIYSFIPLKRERDYLTGGRFAANDIDSDLDRMTAQMQEITNADLVVKTQDAADQATAAAALAVPAATNAAASETAAGISEANAATSETESAANANAALIGIASGYYGFATKALMDADLTPADNAIAIVTNDATTANNGTWRKSGASGAGSWVQSNFDRVAIVENTAAFPDQGTLKVGIDSKVSEHLRGDAELLNGTSAYGQNAVAIFRYFGRGVTFDELELAISAITPGNAIEIRMYQSSVDPQTVGVPWDLSAQILLGTISWTGVSGHIARTFYLPAPISVANGTWLVLGVVATDINNAALTRFTVDTYGDRDNLLFNTLRDLTAMGRGSATYLQGSFNLFYRGEQIARDLNIATNASAITALEREDEFVFVALQQNLWVENY